MKLQFRIMIAIGLFVVAILMIILSLHNKRPNELVVKNTDSLKEEIYKNEEYLIGNQIYFNLF